MGSNRTITLDDLAATKPDPGFRHILLTIREHDRSDFARILCRRLDQLARVGAKVKHTATTVLGEEDNLLWVATVIYAIDRSTLDKLSSNATSSASIALGADADDSEEFIGFDYPQ